MKKKALSEIYKVKDQYDDVVIRTNGASTNVKQHEVNRQVREPLAARYKEWKRVTKLGEFHIFIFLLQQNETNFAIRTLISTVLSVPLLTQRTFHCHMPLIYLCLRT